MKLDFAGTDTSAPTWKLRSAFRYFAPAERSRHTCKETAGEECGIAEIAECHIQQL